MGYRFNIKSTQNNQYTALFAYNAEPLMWSETLTTKATAVANANIVKKHACTATVYDMTNGGTASGYRFEVRKASDGQFFARFVASNGEIVMSSELYTTKQNAVNCAVSTRDNSADAPVYDLTLRRSA